MEVRIVIDGQVFELPADTDPAELRRRVAQAVFRCEVEQLHLADGHTMLVNWRSVRTIQINVEQTDPPAPALPHGTPPTAAAPDAAPAANGPCHHQPEQQPSGS